MPKTRVSCPQCRQPITAEIDQLLDTNLDPTAKQRLLSGAINLLQCPACGYQGALASPLVYHDPDKELLLTFVPAELGIPRNDQERLIGGLINQAISKLPQEKRKGYILRPQATLTLQGLVERVLEADGITKEMIQAQQKKINLLQRLASAPDEKSLAEIAQAEDSLVDAEFFGLLRRLAEAAMMNGDQNSAHKLAELQRSLLSTTTFGRQVQAQSKEVDTAMQELRALGKDLTREKMLELVINAPNPIRLSAYVSLGRPVLDYAFFQLLSERIDRSRADGRERLVELRTHLLEMTQQIDKQIEGHVQEVRQGIQMILQAKDVKEAMTQNLEAVDEYFVQELETALTEARKAGDLEKSGKLGQMMQAIQDATQPPAEVHLIEEYLDEVDDEGRREFLQEHASEITPQFIETLGSIVMQVQESDDAEFAERAAAANRVALRFSMERQMRG